MMKEMQSRKGHLIHIGGPKTGSTFLQEWFRQNPYMHYAPGGVAGFYNVYQIPQFAAQNAGGAFHYFATSDESLATPYEATGAAHAHGEDTQAAAQLNVCSTLQSIFPNGKILYVTRGYKSFLASGYSQYVRDGGTQSLRAMNGYFLMTMQQAGPDGKDGGALDYTFIVKNYQAAFGKDNFMVLPYELLRDDSRKFISIIEQWLDIPHFEASIGKLNTSLSPTELYWYPRISAKVTKISGRLGKKAHSKIYAFYAKRVFNNKLSRTIKFLNWLKPGRTFSESDVSSEVLDYIKSHNAVRYAAIFRDNPLYASYLQDYLLS
jgi:Sulfotransferase domain